MNTDKREVVCPWCLGGGAKLWEWAASPYGAVCTLLLRQSSETGGGDYDGDHTIVGHWAGDHVVLVGDYDRSGLWDELPSYRNVTAELVEAWNSFIELPERKLRIAPDSCWRHAEDD